MLMKISNTPPYQLDPSEYYQNYQRFRELCFNILVLVYANQCLPFMIEFSFRSKKFASQKSTKSFLELA